MNTMIPRGGHAARIPRRGVELLLAALLAAPALHAAPVLTLAPSAANAHTTEYLATDVSLPAASDCTWEAWVRTPVPGLAENRLMGQTDWTSEGRLLVEIRNGQFALFYRLNGSNFRLMGATTVGTNAWCHVAATRSGATVSLYVDGVLEATTNNFTDLVADAPFILAPAFNGAVADVRVWRTARTAEQIRLFKDRRLAADEEGLAGYWPLTDDAPGTARNRVTGVASVFAGYGGASGATTAIVHDGALVCPGLVDAVATYRVNGVIQPQPWPFRTDAGQISAGTTIKDISDHVPVLGLDDWAPALVYRGERYRVGDFTNTFTRLVPNARYRFDLLVTELYYTAAGERAFNLALNGEQVLTNFDGRAEAGIDYAAFTKSFATTSDGSGRIAAVFSKGAADNPHYSGLAVWGDELPSRVGAHVDRRADGGVVVTVSGRDVLAGYVQRAETAAGPWTDVARLLRDEAYTNAAADVAAAVYRVVASNGVGKVAVVSDAAQSVYAINTAWDGRALGRFAPEDYALEEGWPQRLLSCVNPQDYQVAHAVPTAAASWGPYAKALAWRFPNLTPGRAYGLRLYLIDGTFSDSGKRVVSVAANDQTLEESFDYWDRIGARHCLHEAVWNGIVAAADGTLTVVVTARVDNAQIHALEIVDPAGDGTPPMPTMKGATVLPAGTLLSAGAQTGFTAYDFRRRRAGAAGYETVAEGVALDYLVVGETDTEWLYSARARANGRASVWSAEEVAARAADAPDAPETWVGVYAAAGAADVYAETEKGRTWRSWRLYSARNVSRSTQTATAANTGWVRDCPPLAVLGGMAYGNYHCALTNLLPSTHYMLRLHTGEFYFPCNAADAGHGQRQMALRLNSNSWDCDDPGFDFFANWGKNRFNTREYHVLSDHLGRIFLQAVNEKNNAQFAAVEAVPAPVPAAAGAALTARTAAANPDEREIFATTVSALAFDWTDGAPAGADADGNEILLSGTLIVPVQDDYVFTAAQVGDGFLYIDDAPVATVWGAGATSASGTVHLCAGPHAIRYRVFQRGIPARGAVTWAGASGAVSAQTVGAPHLRAPATSGGTGDWRLRHVGNYRAGTDVYSIGTAPDNGSTRYRMASTGRNYWEANEAYPFFSRRVWGDGSLRVRLVRAQKAAMTYTGFGIALRTTAGADDWIWNLANYVEMTGSPTGDVNLGLRARGDAVAADGRSVGNLVSLLSSAQRDAAGVVTGINLPLWLQITRTNDVVSLDWSRDGVVWSNYYATAVAPAVRLYAGVVAVAGDAGVPEYEFDSLDCTFRRPGFIVIVR